MHLKIIAIRDAKPKVDNQLYGQKARRVIDAGFREFTVYYKPGESKASFIVPKGMEVSGVDNYTTKPMNTLSNNPLVNYDGQIAVSVSLNGDNIDVPIENFGKLVVAGEVKIGDSFKQNRPSSSGTLNKVFAFRLNTRSELDNHKNSLSNKARAMLNEMKEKSPELAKYFGTRDPGGRMLFGELKITIDEMLMNSFDVTKQYFLEQQQAGINTNYRGNVKMDWSFNNGVLKVVVTDNGVGSGDFRDRNGVYHKPALSSAVKNQKFLANTFEYMGGMGVGSKYWEKIDAVNQDLELQPGQGTQILTIDFNRLQELGWR